MPKLERKEVKRRKRLGDKEKEKQESEHLNKNKLKNGEE